MKTLLDIGDAKRIDTEAMNRFGISEELLLENVGRSAWHVLQSFLQPHSRVLYVIGGGNNGADGLVMARHQCYTGAMPTLVQVGTHHRASVQKHLKICRASQIPLIMPEAVPPLSSEDWIVDAITGIGLKGPLRTEAADVVAWMNQSPARVCALDVPSGLREGGEEGDPIVRADLTLSVGMPKQLCYQPLLRDFCGDIRAIYGSFPPSLLTGSLEQVLLEEADMHRLVRIPSPKSYKNSRGVLAVFAGSESFPGAMLLCVKASQHSLCGLVRVISDVCPASLVHAPEATWTREFHPERYQAALAGPGWGRAEAQQTQLQLLIHSDIPLVLDADALNLLADTSFSRSADLVLTPHPLEAARLAEVSTEDILRDAKKAALELAQRYHATVVLKGHVIWIAEPGGRVAVVDGLQAVLATAGSGDVLAGIIAGLLAAGHGAWDAACAGTLLHQAAGRLLHRERGWSTAGFLIEYVAKILGQQSAE